MLTGSARGALLEDMAFVLHFTCTTITTGGGEGAGDPNRSRTASAAEGSDRIREAMATLNIIYSCSPDSEK
jgi:hypothetical protein